MTHEFNSLDLPATPAEVEVRLARSEAEVAAAQRLRYRVFFEEMGAKPCPAVQASGRDLDKFDAVCDHLLAFADGAVVGTYRLIGRQAAEAAGGFYSADEFDIAPLLDYPGNVLELGRSCVDARWRSRGAVQALWQGLAAYIVEHRIDLLFGCASLPGADAERHVQQLTYLRDNHLAPLEFRARAHAPVQTTAEAEPCADLRRIFCALPPLLKGYLRAGAWVGDGAVIDHHFNTTDVLVVMDTAAISSRYQRRFEANKAS
ncbi:MAG: GNAT family N-acetyltransferase [Magnetospirillum sp.]|nr:GNAT family N-acetyltransferase [Magnetospirillum sp.]